MAGKYWMVNDNGDVINSNKVRIMTHSALKKAGVDIGDYKDIADHVQKKGKTVSVTPPASKKVTPKGKK